MINIGSNDNPKYGNLIKDIKQIDPKGIIFFCHEGWGAGIQTLAECCAYAIERKIPLLIYPYTIYSRKFPLDQLNNTLLLSWFLDYFVPKIPYKIIDSFNYIEYTSYWSSIAYEPIFKYDNLSFIKITDKIHDFDNEYLELDKKYSLHNRVGLHLRFMKKSFNIEDFKNTSVFIATDNTYYIRLETFKDAFLLSNINRPNKSNIDIENVQKLIKNVLTNSNLNENLIEKQNRINDLKEAYFISKCKNFYGTNSSFYSRILIPFLRGANEYF